MALGTAPRGRMTGAEGWTRCNWRDSWPRHKGPRRTYEAASRGRGMPRQEGPSEAPIAKKGVWGIRFLAQVSGRTDATRRDDRFISSKVVSFFKLGVTSPAMGRSSGSRHRAPTPWTGPSLGYNPCWGIRDWPRINTKGPPLRCRGDTCAQGRQHQGYQTMAVSGAETHPPSARRHPRRGCFSMGTLLSRGAV